MANTVGPGGGLVGPGGALVGPSVGTPLPPPPSTIQIVNLEMELDGRNADWFPIIDWRIADGIAWERGLSGSGVADCLAEPGNLRFTLDNSAQNSVRLLGYYSPDHVNVCPGFKLGTGVRLRMIVGSNIYILFTGYLDHIEPDPGSNETSFRTVCEAVGWMDVAQKTRLSGTLPILLDATGDEVFQTIIDSLDEFAKPRAVEKDVSVDVYPYILDRVRDEQTRLYDELNRLAVSGIDKIWERGDGTIVYESRTRRNSLAIDSDTFVTHRGFKAARSTDSVINASQSTVHPRLPGEVGVVLFSLNKATELPPGQKVEILAPWTDPDNPSIRVGAVSLETAVAITDYRVATYEDGTGADLTSLVSVVTELSGNATKFSFTMSGTTTGWLVKLQQRGQPLLDYGAVVAQEEDASSIQTYGYQASNLDLPYQADVRFGTEVAQFIVFNRAAPMTKVEAFKSFAALTNNTQLDRLLARDVSDRIKIQDPTTGIVQSFFIDHIRGAVRDGFVEIEWSLSLPIPTTAFWRLEVIGFSELDTTTRLNFGLIIGHTDVAHGDVTHGDVAHADTLHSDVIHGDNSHTDIAHSDSAHIDSTHGDVAHSDVSHSDVAHGDATTHDDHNDQAGGHNDTGGGKTHSDVAHSDSHTDVPHTDQMHSDYTGTYNHTDGAIHEDGPQHDDGWIHGDGATYHQDLSHGDIIHGDVSHSDVSHADNTHEDFSGHTDTGHTDVPHSDSHTDVAHSDLSHGDTAHGDAAVHLDIAFSDVAHADSHTDVAFVDIQHGDAN